MKKDKILEKLDELIKLRNYAIRQSQFKKQIAQQLGFKIEETALDYERKLNRDFKEDLEDLRNVVIEATAHNPIVGQVLKDIDVTQEPGVMLTKK